MTTAGEPVCLECGRPVYESSRVSLPVGGGSADVAYSAGCVCPFPRLSCPGCGVECAACETAEQRDVDQRTGGGSAPDCGAQAPIDVTGEVVACDMPKGHAGGHSRSGDGHRGAQYWAEGGGSAELPTPELPPVRRCRERVSVPGEAIENCDTVLGYGATCFVCSGKRCYIHCGCLAHHRGAKVVTRGGNGTFEWCVWELEHGFRGQLLTMAADRSGLVILGTHGGASAGAVLAILMRNIERIQERTVRGEVIGQSAKPRPANEAAGELADADPVDPEEELRRMDAKVALLLSSVRRARAAETGELEKLRVWSLRICQDWLKATEQTWRDLSEDPEQNPRSVWASKELHDQQTADLFFQIGQLFNGGAL